MLVIWEEKGGEGFISIRGTKYTNSRQINFGGCLFIADYSIHIYRHVADVTCNYEQWRSCLPRSTLRSIQLMVAGQRDKPLFNRAHKPNY